MTPRRFTSDLLRGLPTRPAGAAFSNPDLAVTIIGRGFSWADAAVLESDHGSVSGAESKRSSAKELKVARPYQRRASDALLNVARLPQCRTASANAEAVSKSYRLSGQRSMIIVLLAGRFLTITTLSARP